MVSVRCDDIWTRFLLSNWVHVLSVFVAPSYPRNVVVEAINRATVQVQWSTPIPTNGIIVRYRVSLLIIVAYVVITYICIVCIPSCITNFH